MLGVHSLFMSGVLDLRVQRDAVSAEFSSGGNVPRVVPARNVIGTGLPANNGLGASLEVVDVESQPMWLWVKPPRRDLHSSASLSKSFMLDMNQCSWSQPSGGTSTMK